MSGLLSEFDLEIEWTGQILKYLPENQFAWAPHDRSSTLGRLANHLASIPAWPALLISGKTRVLAEAETKAGVIAAFDENVAVGRAAIEKAGPEVLWREVMVSFQARKPMERILRERVVRHMVHHRGQLTVYLGMLGLEMKGGGYYE